MLQSGGGVGSTEELGDTALDWAAGRDFYFYLGPWRRKSWYLIVLGGDLVLRTCLGAPAFEGDFKA